MKNSDMSGKSEWLELLKRLQAGRGNAVLATLEAKRQRPDLWRAWIGQKADGQMELFDRKESDAK